MRSTTPVIWFAGGGTGGHLAPGIAVAEWLLREVPVRCQFLTSGRPAERAMLAGACVPALEHPLPVPDSRWNRLAYGFSLAREAAAMAAHFLRVRPAAVVGLGAYGSVPAALAARAVGVPVFLLEQNVLPGRANRLLARWAAEIHVMWEESRRLFPDPARVRVIGNPVRAQALRGTREEAVRALGLDPRKRTVLVMGGSQGAGPINEAFVAAAPVLARFRDRVQWVHLTGERSCRVCKGALKNTSLSSVVLPYLDRIGLAYAAADLVICRAGGTTIAELLARGLAAVLVPFEAAADGHQLANALAAESRGVCRVVRERELGPARLRDLVSELVLEAEPNAAMAGAALAAARPGAAAELGRRLVQMIGARKAACLDATPAGDAVTAGCPVPGAAR